MGALSGLKVLDLSRILAGPLVGQMLGDLGADVIKVERPGRGDDAREMGPPFLTDTDGEPLDVAGFFLSCNRNKKSVAIDIQTADGQALVRQLARQADVLIENYKVGTLARYGLGWGQLSAENPSLVYCSITGFGQTGPYAPKPGYDGVFQAMSGLMSVSGVPRGEPGEGPMKVGISIVDILTSYNAAVAILAALRHRDAHDGQGQYIDMSLLDCGIAALSHFAQNYLISGVAPERRGNGGFGGIPSQAFQCADRLIFVVAGNDEQFGRLCTAIGRPDLAGDERFRRGPDRIANRLALLERLNAVFLQQPAAHWVEAIDKAGVPVSFVNELVEVFEDPQVRSRGAIVEQPHPQAGTLKLLANPLRLSATPVDRYGLPPALGEHTNEVLTALGLSESQIDELRSRKVVG